MKQFNGYGHTNPNAKLTPEQIEEINTNPEGLTQKQLAAKFGVHHGTISNAKRGATYSKPPKNRNHNAKTDPAGAERIREKVAAGMLIKEAAATEGISASAASKIINGRAWA